MIVIFDIDDVLIPWAAKAHEACVAAGLTDKPSWSTWNMSEDYGVTLEAWLEVVNGLAVEGGIYHAPPYPGVPWALNYLESRGHDVHLVTARGFFANAELIRRWTAEWMVQYNIPGQLEFTQDKGEHALKIGATHAIDDRFENVESMLRAGVDTYLMTQPHNKNLPGWPENRRVKSAVEFVERILANE